MLILLCYLSELLQVSNFDSRDGKELLRNVEQSYRDPVLGATFKFEKLELVHNDKLSSEVRVYFAAYFLFSYLSKESLV